MLTKHPSYSFSCLTPYNYVFYRNEENKTKSKRFGQEMRKLCMEEAMVVTIAIYGCDHISKLKKNSSVELQHGRDLGHDHRAPLQQLSITTFSVWSRPQQNFSMVATIELPYSN